MNYIIFINVQVTEDKLLSVRNKKEYIISFLNGCKMPIFFLIELQRPPKSKLRVNFECFKVMS